MINYCQEIVTQYISHDLAIFISEEYWVEVEVDGRKTGYWIDILAADILQNELYLVEVSYTEKPAKLAHKVGEFYARMPIIRRALINGKGIGDQWSIRPWVFIRKQSVPYFLSKLGGNFQPKITYLEFTPFPWIYENVRRQSLEPGKPYPDLPPEYQ